jgi:hypothetical protein
MKRYTLLFVKFAYLKEFFNFLNCNYYASKAFDVLINKYKDSNYYYIGRAALI